MSFSELKSDGQVRILHFTRVLSGVEDKVFVSELVRFVFGKAELRMSEIGTSEVKTAEFERPELENPDFKLVSSVFSRNLFIKSSSNFITFSLVTAEAVSLILRFLDSGSSLLDFSLEFFKYCEI